MNAVQVYQGVERRVLRSSLKLVFRVASRKRHARLCLERAESLSLLIPPDVFNPTLFGSSLFLARYLQRLALPVHTRALDLGCGSGVLGLVLARAGLQVVGSDCNPEAVWAAATNAHLNGIAERYEARCGLAYAPVAGEKFDLIVMNPPYYAHEPRTPLEQAFMAGEGYSVLRTMIGGAGQHLASGGRALAVLSSTVPLAVIKHAAHEGNVRWRYVATRRYWAEHHIIYEFSPER